MSIQVFPKLGGIRWQLILGSSMILIGVFTAAGLGVRQLTSSTLYGTIDRELATRADRTAARLQRGEPALAVAAADRDLASVLAHLQALVGRYDLLVFLDRALPR